MLRSLAANTNNQPELLTGRHRYLLLGGIAMPRYFFHIRSAEKSLPDCEGLELAGASAARCEASCTVQDFCQAATGQVSPGWEGWCVEVCDQRGRPLFRLPFADAPKLKQVKAKRRDGDIALAEIVYLDVERRKRELPSFENMKQERVPLDRLREDQNRHDAEKLHHTQSMTETAGGSDELIARSQRQQPSSDWPGLAQELDETDGGGDRQQA